MRNHQLDSLPSSSLPSFTNSRRFRLFLTITAFLLFLIPISYHYQPKFSTTPNATFSNLLVDPFITSKLFQYALQPSTFKPYYHKSSKTPLDSQVTLCVHLDIGRAYRLADLAESWKGPMSVVYHLHPNQYPPTLNTSNPYVSENVDIHLVIDNFDRQFNLWRNIARFLSPTKYILQLDVDFTPTNHFTLDNRLLSRLDTEKVMYILPAFEFLKSASAIPLITKQDVISSLPDLETFHSDWPRAHGPSDYKKWINATKPYKVTHYNYHYEPYAVMAKIGPPWCDERFIGYGSNKAACFYEAHLADYKFLILPNDFVIHVEHPYNIDRGSERKLNRRFYEIYRDERCLYYNRQKFPNGLVDGNLTDKVKCMGYSRSGLSQGMIKWKELSEEELVHMETEVGGSVFVGHSR